MKIFYFFALVALVYCTSAHSQDECYQVLRLASRNYTETQTKSLIAHKIYNEYTKGFSATNSATVGLDLAKTSSLIKETFGISGSSDSKTIQQFRSQYESGFFNQEDFSKKTNLVVEEAIRAWKECQELRNSDVNFKVADANQFITFSVKQSSGKSINITGVFYSDKCMECFISDSKKTTKATKDSRVKISEGKVLSITCKRLALVNDSTTFYPNADISINTDLGNLTVPIPEKTAPSIKWLSDVTTELAMLDKSIQQNALNDSLNFILLNQAIASLKNEAAKTYFSYSDILIGYYAPSIGQNQQFNFKNNRILTGQTKKWKGVMWVDLAGKVGNIDPSSQYRIYHLSGAYADYLTLCKKDQKHKEVKLYGHQGAKQFTFIAVKVK